MTALVAALVLMPSTSPERPAAPAATVLRTAQTKAKREGKNVLVLFKASWCRWCHRFDDLLADPALRPAWQRSYVVARINIRERGEQKKLENIGWEEVLKTIRGRADLDVPDMAVLDPQGTKLADSLRVGEGPIPANAGYPTRPEEIAAFVGSVGRTGRFSAEEMDLLKSRFAPPKG